MLQLCEDLLETVEPPVKRRRGRPRLYEPTYQPKSLKTLCEQVLNRQLPRRRGKKRKRVFLRSPLSLKKLCQAAIESKQLERKKRVGRRRKLFNPPSLKELCQAVLDKKKQVRKKREIIRSQRRKKFNKRLLGFADIPSVIKSSYRDRLRFRRAVLAKETANVRSKVFVKRVLEKPKAIIDKPKSKVTVEKPKLTVVDKPKLRAIVEKPKLRAFVEKPKLRAILEKPKLRAILEKPKLRSVVDKPKTRASVEKPRTRASVEKPTPMIEKLRSRTIVEKPKPVVIKKAVVKRIKQVVIDSDSDDLIYREPPRKPIKTYKRKPKSNGNLVETKENVQLETVFRLQLPEERDILEKSQINIRFTDLLKDIQKVSLPSTAWKIKIILYNQQISQIVFSNKSSPERCVNVYRNTKYYDISFDKTFVYFLGAPLCVDSLQDLNFLLMIVHTVKENDPVLQYVQK